MMYVFILSGCCITLTHYQAYVIAVDEMDYREYQINFVSPKTEPDMHNSWTRYHCPTKTQYSEPQAIYYGYLSDEMAN